VENAPFIVRECLASWRKYNPDWEIRVLDSENINQYFDFKTLFSGFSKTMRQQALSNVIRINLLKEYGGVWVDSTCLCREPLDAWITHYTTSGFFAFERPGRDRMLSSWFMAAKKDNYLVSRYARKMNRFWTSNHLTLATSEFVEEKKWEAKTYKWFSFWVLKYHKVYPYFIFHYMFEKIYHSDSKFKSIWDSTPKISADLPHLPQRWGLLNSASESFKEDFKNNPSYLYKLFWNFDAALYKEDTVLHHLLNS
jgi:hypothetical protein